MSRPSAFLSAEEEVALFERMAAGDMSARDRIVLAHTALAFRLAKKFHSNAMTDEDLRSEAMVGLMIAVDKFDVTKGFRFSTYAQFWVKACVRDACMKNVSEVTTLTTRDMSVITFRYPRAMIEEARANPNATQAEIEALAAKKLGLSKGQIEKARLILGASMVSLDAPLEGGAQVGDIIPDTAPGPEEIVEAADSAAFAAGVISEAMETLNDRERMILNARFLCEKDNLQTLDQVGEKLRVSKERVRQIQSVALKKIERFIRRKQK